jgi:hypothetical protein
MPSSEDKIARQLWSVTMITRPPAFSRRGAAQFNYITPANAGGRFGFRIRGLHRWPGVAEFFRSTNEDM